MHSLYAVENAVSVLCRSCRRPIDIWFDHGLEISRAGVTKRPEVARRLCLGCLLRTFPLEQQEQLAPAYEHQRKLPREAGVPPWVTAYALLQEGGRDTWSEGYLSIGFAVQVRGWDCESAERQPHVTIIPSDPSEDPCSLVFCAATVRHRDVKAAYLKFIWPFHDLSLPERFEIVNGRDRSLREADRSVLMRGQYFWQARIPPSRPTGTGNYGYGEEDKLLGDIERILARHERDGIRITNVQMLADKLGTVGRTQLFAMFRRVPEARDRFRRHKRKSLDH